MTATIEQKKILGSILSNVGDMGFKHRILTILDYLDVQPGDHVLDCGCGEGFYTMVLSELYDCKITALDSDEPLLKIARERVGNKLSIEFKVGDATRIPYSDNTFDKIILTEVLEHVPNDLQALLEVKRVMKPGGVLAITVPNHNYPFFWDPVNKTLEAVHLGHVKKGLFAGIWDLHIRLYYPDEIKSVVEKAGFKIEDFRGILHYCLPFNQNILRFFKLFYTNVPLPQSVYHSMEKFSWKEEKKKKSLFNPIPWCKKIIEWVDKPNDKFESTEKSAMCVAIKAKK